MKQKRKSLGQELIKVLEAAINNPSSVKTVRTSIDVKKIRNSLNMTQKAFAEAYGFGLETLRKWEQGVNFPDQSVMSYLICIKQEPEFISKLIKRDIKKVLRG